MSLDKQATSFRSAGHERQAGRDEDLRLFNSNRCLALVDVELLCRVSLKLFARHGYTGDSFPLSFGNAIDGNCRVFGHSNFGSDLS
jgi:hypothetical protein